MFNMKKAVGFTLVMACLCISAASQAVEPRTEYYAGISNRVAPDDSVEIPNKVRAVIKLFWDSDNNRIVETVHNQPVGGDRPEYSPVFQTNTYVNTIELVSMGPDSAVFFAQSPGFSGPVTYYGAPWEWTHWDLNLTTPIPTPFGVIPFPLLGQISYSGFGLDVYQEVINPFDNTTVFAFDSNFVHINEAAYNALVRTIEADM